ncbi:hypothetical protein [Cognatilysobacter lacus]|uniref:Thioredoxin domain-containing protein n=1 Tax=Cognatilysobacter lacus TaxID=1643323 RepID=A0A5D8Z991_9GAMM|nr:hypothetical protein [Lysobacter lacus]TZF91505.1 hypothetical protein FW784_01635 [Lysobacter lacus]
MTADALPDAIRRRNRFTLIAIVLLFLGTMLVAGVMRFADIHPAATRQKGELLNPYTDLRDVHLRTLDGTPYEWAPIHRTWRIVAAAPNVCDDACARRAHDIGVVWEILNKDASRVDVLWWCPTAAGCSWPRGLAAPSTLHVVAADPARQRLPRVDVPGGVPVYLVDPNGFVVLRYAPGADLGDLRADLVRLLKLQ